MLAAEIALSNTVGRASTLAKGAKLLLESGKFGNKALSELRVAVGSQEVWYGNARLGRRLLRDGLAEATENAVAQVAWFARRGEFGVAGPDLRGHTESAEAEAWSAFYSGRWSDCLAACSDWWRLEPYSSRAPELGSFVAATVGDDPHACVEFARLGLEANPNNPSLLNNYAVGLAYSGQIEEAKAAVERAAASALVGPVQIALDATRGLIAFRVGDPEGGRALYQMAIDGAAKSKDEARALLAELHLLREEMELAKRQKDGRPIPLERLHVLQKSSDPVASAFAAALVRRLPD